MFLDLSASRFQVFSLSQIPWVASLLKTPISYTASESRIVGNAPCDPTAKQFSLTNLEDDNLYN